MFRCLGSGRYRTVSYCFYDIPHVANSSERVLSLLLAVPRPLAWRRPALSARLPRVADAGVNVQYGASAGGIATSHSEVPGACSVGKVCVALGGGVEISRVNLVVAEGRTILDNK
ncbi:hypothetical protein C8Q76DRAFT_229979 [Earliella scabrosa]|nr:hypothetical protein C8Q76DRAFT_229979 [Earliella scabrosa]